MRHLLSIADLEQHDFLDLLQRARAVGEGEEGRQYAASVGLIFLLTSTRTRSSFFAAAHTLGASALSVGPDELQVATGETLEDTIRVLSNYFDVIVVRSNLPSNELSALASVSAVPVVNAMSLIEHPTQALCDLACLAHRFGGLAGRTIAYVGEGNSTAVALAYAAARIHGLQLEVITPPGFELPVEVATRVDALSGQFGGVVIQSTDPEPERQADVVYATRWQTTGTEKSVADWRERFRPFHVDDGLFDRLTRGVDAVFMHDLPAHRGEDCSAELLDGPRSIAFEQAAWKQHAAQSVLEWCLH